METIRLGDWTITAFEESRFAMDGGAMFGVVPRIIWKKLLPPDSENRVPMRANVFVVRAGDANLILDAGLGDVLSDMDRKIYAPSGPSRTTAALTTLGLTSDDITHVVLTHLHTDHANGVFVGDPDHLTLRFPKAEHFVQRDEWDDAMHPTDRTAVVYHPERFAYLADVGSLHLLDGDDEIIPGVTVVKTGGHTRGHQGVRVTQAGETFLFYADVLPTRFHLKGPYVSALDLYPMDTMKVKREVLAECCDQPIIIGFCHDISVLMGRIVQKEKWMDVVAVDSVPVN